jgi:hypothetical protein
LLSGSVLLIFVGIYKVHLEAIYEPQITCWALSYMIKRRY